MARTLIATLCAFVLFLVPVYATCGGTLTTSGGIISSPNHPSDYQASENCEWGITVDEGKMISLVFTDFHLESQSTCNFDSVTVYDGNSRIGKFCGSTIPSIIQSSGRSMKIVFKTDGSGQFAGFQAVYFARLQPACHLAGRSCGQVLTAQTGVITSPFYPDLYQNNENCAWDIRVESGKVISVSFINFVLEECCDSVTVYDGNAENLQIIEKIFGSSLPDKVQSSNNFMRIVFETDGSEQYMGFQAVYYTTSPSGATECGKNLTAPRGMITVLPYPNDYLSIDECVWDISMDAGKITALVFVNFDLGENSTCENSSVTVYDGKTENSSMIGKFCGSALPKKIRSSGMFMKVVFRTDHSIEHSGFQAVYYATKQLTVPNTSAGTTRSEGLFGMIFLPVVGSLGLLCLTLVVALLCICARRSSVSRPMQQTECRTEENMVELYENQQLPMADVPRYVTTPVDEYIAPALQVPIQQEPFPPIPIADSCIYQNAQVLIQQEPFLPIPIEDSCIYQNVRV